MISGSPPRWVTWNPRESSDTAIRALIFSREGRRIAADAERARDRWLAEWYVTTTGHSAAHRASSERLGGAGSWGWSAPTRPPLTQRRTRPATTVPNDIRPTAPL